MLATAAAIAGGWTTGTHGLRADVDGDGRPDTLTLARHKRFFVLRLDTRDRLISKTVRGFSGYKPSAQGEPRIVALRQLNRRRGLEVLVRVWHGASNDFLVLFTLSGGRIVAMTGGPHDPADPPFVWDLGGSAGTATSQADCVARGRVGVVLRWHHRGVWHQRLTLYNASATRFARAAVYEVASKQLRSPPRDWPTVRRLEFESCGGMSLPQ